MLEKIPLRCVNHGTNVRVWSKNEADKGNRQGSVETWIFHSTTYLSPRARLKSIIKAHYMMKNRLQGLHNIHHDLYIHRRGSDCRSVTSSSHYE